MLTDLAGSVKGWRCFKVRQPGRRSDRRVSEGECGVLVWGNGLESPFYVGEGRRMGAAVPGIAGVWAWTSGARWSIASEMDSLSGGLVPDDVVLYGTADGARLPRYEVSKKG